MTHIGAAANIDRKTVEGFGEEWDSFDQRSLSDAEWGDLFECYFGIFPWDTLPEKAEGFDLGCGSGRWAKGVAARVGRLNCIDPSDKALAVARKSLGEGGNAVFHCAGVDEIPLAEGSQDFGYSLGVLHHIPDTQRGLDECVRRLKPGAPFLLYLYYAFDNRPLWFRLVWRLSDMMRKAIAVLPFPVRKFVTSILAGLIYWPLARGARLLERLGINVSNIPLSAYRHKSFYTMRTDSLDRFGTRLEHRYTRAEITAMMRAAGLEQIEFSEEVPFWVSVGRKKSV